jgi:hypothetical protein
VKRLIIFNVSGEKSYHSQAGIDKQAFSLAPAIKEIRYLNLRIINNRSNFYGSAILDDLYNNGQS